MKREEISRYKLTYGIRIGAGFYLIYMVYESIVNTELESHMQLNIIIAAICALLAVVFIYTGIKGFKNLSVEQRLLDEREEREEQEREAREAIRAEKEEQERQKKLDSVEDRSALLTFEEEDVGS